MYPPGAANTGVFDSALVAIGAVQPSMINGFPARQNPVDGPLVDTFGAMNLSCPMSTINGARGSSQSPPVVFSGGVAASTTSTSVGGPVGTPTPGSRNGIASPAAVP